MNEQDISKVMGKPYVEDGRGPDGYDCWGLVTQFASGVPDHWKVDHAALRDIVAAFGMGIASGEWQAADPPQDGDVVALSRKNAFHHAGIWWQGGVLHADRPRVMWQPIASLKRLGWRRIEVYRWQPSTT